MMRVAITLVFVTAATVAFADEITITPESAPIARPLVVRLNVELSPGERVEYPEKPPLPEGVELLDTAAAKPEKREDGSIVQSVEYRIESYRIGPARIPELEYAVIGADGERTVRKAGPVSFEIVSVRDDPETADELKDIRPPVEIPLRPEKYAAPFLAFLAALVAGALLWRWWSRRAREKPAPPPPPIPAHEIAYEQLERLRASDPFGRGKYQEHFYQLSEIMRAYVERRYGVQALERTTFELRREFDKRYEDDATRERLYGLLDACDLVKFAKHKPARANADDSLKRAVEWIDRTRPAPAAPEEAA